VPLALAHANAEWEMVEGEDMSILGETNCEHRVQGRCPACTAHRPRTDMERLDWAIGHIVIIRRSQLMDSLESWTITSHGKELAPHRSLRDAFDAAMDAEEKERG
jgi:hypothetical protein